MKMIIEISDHNDMMELHAMLSSYSRMAQHMFQSGEPSGRVNFTEEAPKKPNGAAEPVVDAKTAPEAPPVEEVAETQPTPEPEPVDNPFADDVAKARKPKKLSREDVNAAFTAYIHTYGQTAAMTDVVKLLTEHFAVNKLSGIPNTQEAYRKAIDVVTMAIEQNTFGREAI